jgi:hypothetical protein
MTGKLTDAIPTRARHSSGAALRSALASRSNRQRRPARDSVAIRVPGVRSYRCLLTVSEQLAGQLSAAGLPPCWHGWRPEQPGLAGQLEHDLVELTHIEPALLGPGEQQLYDSRRPQLREHATPRSISLRARALGADVLASELVPTRCLAQLVQHQQLGGAAGRQPAASRALAAGAGRPAPPAPRKRSGAGEPGSSGFRYPEGRLEPHDA